jgi:hypothetical protein
LDSDVKGGIKTESVCEEGVEENVWVEKKLSDGRLEKTA